MQAEACWMVSQLFLSSMVEEGEKPAWRSGQDTWPYLHLGQAKSGRVKLKKRTFVCLVPDIKVWKGTTQHYPEATCPQQDAFHFKDSW